MPADPAVDIRGLRVTYGDVVAVDGLSLTLPRQALTAIVGRNGQGKTTTVEVCCGLRRPDTGEVHVLGLNPQRDGKQLHPRVGVMLQDGGVPTMARPLDFLNTLARFYRNPRPATELLDWLGLDNRTTPFRRLSGGEQQRVKLAAALIGRPELVFLDEPSSGLDPSARGRLWEVLNALRSDGVTVVLSTHLVAEVETLADNVVVIDSGRCVATGTVAELTANASDDLSFSGPMHLDLSTLRQVLPAEVAVSEPNPGRYRVSGRVSPQVIASVTAWCAQHGVAPRELTTGRRSLEDVIHALAADDSQTPRQAAAGSASTQRAADDPATTPGSAQ